MTVRIVRLRGVGWRALLLAAAVTLVPLPALAGDSPPATRHLQASMTRIVARDLAAAKTTPNAAARRAGQGDTGIGQSGGFFRTRAGVLVAAVMIAGAGYAVYSAQHDRIHSPGKK